MEMEIIKRKDNPFLSRTEIYFKITHDYEAGISREKVRDKISSTLSAPKECVIINKLHSEFGKPEITGYAKIYANKECCMKNERKHILIRNKLLEPEKKVEKKKTTPPPKRDEGAVTPKKEEAAPAKPDVKKDEKKVDKKEEKKTEVKPTPTGETKVKEGAEKSKPHSK